VINGNRPPISVISSLRKLAKVIKFAGLKQKKSSEPGCPHHV
jgi:hypothetical protein